MERIPDGVVIHFKLPHCCGGKGEAPLASQKRLQKYSFPTIYANISTTFLQTFFTTFLRPYRQIVANHSYTQNDKIKNLTNRHLHLIILYISTYLTQHFQSFCYHIVASTDKDEVGGVGISECCTDGVFYTTTSTT